MAKILFCTPAAGGNVRWEYASSLLCELFLAPERLNDISRYNVASNLIGGYSGLGKDRAVMASLALREGFDKVFFCDSDQSWKWPDFKRLVDSDKPVVGGIIALKQYPIQLNFVHEPEDKRFFEAEDGVPTPLGVERWRNYHTGQDEMKVGAIGTGFLCIDIKVLKDMVEQKIAEPFAFRQMCDGKPNWVTCWDFFSSGAMNNIYFGEDYGFAVMAQRAGHSVYAHTLVRPAHHGAHTYEVGEVKGGELAGQQQARLNFPTELKGEAKPRSLPVTEL